MSSPKPTLEPIAERRGYAITDLSHATVSYVFVRAAAADAAKALAGLSDGKAVDVMPPHPMPDEVNDQRGRLLFQFKGHPWTVFMGSYDDHDDAALYLSLAGYDVLSFCNEDTSGWSEVVLYRGGEEVEKLTWGLDYSDEMAELQGDDGEKTEPDHSGWDAVAAVVTDAELGMKDAFLFRSKLRKATAEDLQRGEAFVDETFRFHDAYLMDVKEQPHTHHDTGRFKPGKGGMKALAAAWGTLPGTGKPGPKRSETDAYAAIWGTPTGSC